MQGNMYFEVIHFYGTAISMSKNYTKKPNFELKNVSVFLAVQIEEEELKLKKIENDKKKSVLKEDKKVPVLSRSIKPNNKKPLTVPPKVNTNRTNPVPAAKKVSELYILIFLFLILIGTNVVRTNKVIF